MKARLINGSAYLLTVPRVLFLSKTVTVLTLTADNEYSAIQSSLFTSIHGGCEINYNKKEKKLK